MRIENLLGSNQYGYVLNKLDTPGVAWYHTETTANSFDKILPYNSSFVGSTTKDIERIN